MTSYEISQLPAMPAPAAGDLAVVVDVSDTTTPPAGPGGSNKQLTVAGLGQGIAGAHASHAQYWQSLLASRHYQPLAIGCIGDSFTSGNNPGLTQWIQTWPLVLANMVTARYPVVGLTTYGRGCLPPSGNAGVTLPYVTVSGAGTPLAVNGYGFNYATYDISHAGGCTLTYTVEGDNFIICYATQPGGGTFSWKLDSGSVTNVSTSGGSVSDTGIIFIGPVTAGSHTITITWVSGGATWIDGVLEYNGDLSAGAQFYNMGWSDSTAANWAGWNPSMFASIYPNAAIIEVGAADWLAGTSPTTYQSNLNTLISNINAKVPSPISYLLCAPPQPLGTPVSGSYTWQEYVDVMYAVSAANTNVDIIDFTLRMPVADGAGGPYGLYTSGGELTNYAHALVADTLCTFLGPQ